MRPDPQAVRLRRIVITSVIAAIALGVSLLGLLLPSKPPAPPIPSAQTPSQAADSASTQPESASPPVTEQQTTSIPAPEQPAGADETPSVAAGPDDPGELRAVAPQMVGIVGVDTQPAPLGSLNPKTDRMLVEFTRIGGAISRITFSDLWQTVQARRQAEAHERALAKSSPPPPPPDPSRLYVLLTSRSMILQDGSTVDIPALAAHSVTIDGRNVPLFAYSTNAAGEKEYVWAETDPGTFVTQVVNAAGVPLLKITRRISLESNQHELSLDQEVENLSGRELKIAWTQYGPGDLPLDPWELMDRRRFRFGYVSAAIPERNQLVFSDETDLLLERSQVFGDEVFDANDPAAMWPNPVSLKKRYDLSWFASTGRYFALAVHPKLPDPVSGDRTLSQTIARIERQRGGVDPATANFFTLMTSPVRTLAPGAKTTFDMGVFAGPLDRNILEKEQPFVALGMDGLIVYFMSATCAFCTFQWLAHGLLWFLGAVHAVLFDWGVAIIVLVCVVRLLLHPITRKSQVNMQRFGRVMQKIKPELDKLKAKHGDDPKRMQIEQMRLMKEHGASPLHMLGCLPMILQMPIWLALYAMLYFAFELRQEPAFWGFFQLFGNWPFLADLSGPDRFIPLFDEPRSITLLLFMFDYSSINILPLLMGVVFFIQQKYMTPPPSATMTPEQIQQQKIMKVMMVVLFPLLMYSVPSGLNLYIMTSTLIGIFESRWVRRHIDELDKAPPGNPYAPRKSRIRDAAGRAFAEALERAKAKRESQGKNYKKRDR